MQRRASTTARHDRRRARRAVLCGLLAAAATTPARAAGEGAPAGVSPLRGEDESILEQGAPPGLDAAAGPADLERAAAMLARAPGGVDLVLGVRGRGEVHVPENGPRPATRAEAKVCELAVPLLDPAQVRAAAAEALGGDLEWRRAALELMAVHAAAADVGLLLDLALTGLPTASGSPLDDDGVAAALEEALAGLLGRSPALYAGLDGWCVRDERLGSLVERAVGRVGDPRGLDFLLPRLAVGHEGLLAVFRLAPWLDASEARTAAVAVQEHALKADAGRSRLALRALGALGDAAAVPTLLQVLASPEAMDRKAAHAALRVLAGCDLPENPTAWARWYADERAWIRTEAAGVLAALAGPDEAAAVSAVRALSSRKLLGREADALLARLVREHRSPAVRIQAVRALGRLDRPLGRATLVRALGDEAIDVRAEALRTLRTLTGARHPADPARWEAELAFPAFFLERLDGRP